MNILFIDHLNYSYGNSLIISDLKLIVNQNDIVLINGISGSGKSTLLNLISGNLETENPIRINKRVFNTIPLSERARFVSLVQQNPDMQLCTATVEEELRFGLENLHFSEEVISEKIEQALEFIQLTERRHQSVFSLSGGQKQKLILAAIIAMEPKLVLLDEPLSQLDPVAAHDFVSFLHEVQQQTTLSFIVVEHRTELLEQIATQKFTLADGALKAFKPYPEKYIHLEKTAKRGDTALFTKDLSFAIDQNTRLIHHINLDIKSGERIALMGVNGSGKSTLIQLLCGILKPTSGTVVVKQSIGVMFQNPDLMLIERTVGKEIKNEAILTEIDLKDFRLEHPLTLSKGQRLRCAFGSMLTQLPELLILDEPTTGQDISHINQMIQFLGDKTVLFCTHDIHLVKAIATRVLFIEDGTIRNDLSDDPLKLETNMEISYGLRRTH